MVVGSVVAMDDIDSATTPSSFDPGVPSVLTVLPGGAATGEGVALLELGSQIVALAGRVAAATCRWLLLVAEFDAREGADRYGLPSTARWLSHHCGISARTARDHVRVAHALTAHPVLADAMSAGRISYSHARAISRVAQPDEHDLVADLVSMAEYGTIGQLESLVRALRTIDDEVDDPIVERTRQKGETLSAGWEPDSRWRLTSRLDPEHGALVQSALDAVKAAAPQGEHLTGAAALVRLAEIALTALADCEHPPRPLRGHEHAAVVIHLDASAVPQPDTAAADGSGGSIEPLTDNRPGGSAEPPPVVTSARSSGERTRPYARIAGGPGLPDPVLERLACSGRVRLVLTETDRDGLARLLDLGRSQRVVTERQYRALLLRDGGCTHPGCESTWNLEAHHVLHWLHGGLTDLANLVLLCSRHHDAHHRGEFTILALGRQRFRFLRQGRVLQAHVDPSALFDTDTPVEDEHADVAADAADNRGGERMDRRYASSAFATNRYAAHNHARAG